MIECAHVSFSYGTKPVLQDFSAVFPAGVTFLSGPSGSGKSTVLKLLCGLLTPDSGSISGLAGGKRISMVFQENRLLPTLSILDNVRLVHPAGDAEGLLRDMELTEFAEKKPGDLSGGQQRRAALARALCFSGQLLLLDEPFTGLDEALRSRVAARMRGSFPAMILAAHDETEAALLAGEAGYHIVRVKEK